MTTEQESKSRYIKLDDKLLYTPKREYYVEWIYHKSLHGPYTEPEAKIMKREFDRLDLGDIARRKKEGNGQLLKEAKEIVAAGNRIIKLPKQL